MVLFWIINTVSSNILSGIVDASTAWCVWEELKERFDKVIGSRTFNLHREIATISQGAIHVSMYFTRLKDLWNELESLVPITDCECVQSKEFVYYLQRQKLYQLLMGLNEIFYAG